MGFETLSFLEVVCTAHRVYPPLAQATMRGQLFTVASMILAQDLVSRTP